MLSTEQKLGELIDEAAALGASVGDIVGGPAAAGGLLRGALVGIPAAAASESPPAAAIAPPPPNPNGGSLPQDALVSADDGAPPELWVARESVD